MVSPAPPLDPPPRPVPLSLRIRVLGGGLLTAIGWIMLGIGGPLAVIFLRNSDVVDAAWTSGEMATTKARVVAVEPTNLRSNNQRAIRVIFEFEVDGDRHRGASFCFDNPPEPGATLTVDYPVDTPQRARARGMRSRPFGSFALFTLIHPLAALLLLAIAFWRNRRRAWLLANGEAAWGLLTNRRETASRVNNRRVYALTFSFVDRDGTQRSVNERSHRREFFADDIPRVVLHRPGSDDGCVAELCPGPPLIREQKWQPVPTAQVLRVLLLPSFAVLAIAVAYLLAP